MLVVFASLAWIIALFFVVAAAMAREPAELADVQRVGYRFRKRWLFLLAMLVPPVVGLGIIAAPAVGGSDGRVGIDVVGRQFSFTVDPASVPVGTRARFTLSSVDVNHAMGLVDPGGTLIGSVQMMPGYENRLDVTLSKPGTYRLLCFEYCGLAHHLMQGALTVTP